MKKNITKEAYFERIRSLADVNKNQIKESKSRNLGNLIDYKRAADNIAYGIIKENHHYYIKKAGIKQDPNVADFAYIGGQENITSYQYNSLSEADKHRSLLFKSISDANSLKPNKSKSKMILNEDVAGNEIDAAADKVNDLDTAAAQEEMPSEPSPEGLEGGMPEELPNPEGEDIPKEIPEPEGGEGAEHEAGETPEEEKAEHETGEELPDEGGEEGAEGMEGGEATDEPNKEIEKAVGKLTNTIRKTKMTDSQVKSYLNSFITAFRDKLPELEIEDRKAMANKILKVVGQEDINDLENSMPDEEIKEEATCDECGGFTKYAESRGYDQNTIKECGDDEMGNLVSGYANAHNDGQNDGDLETVAIFITPEILDSLKSEYGHDDYAEKLTPYSQSMNEMTAEDKAVKINELTWTKNENISDPANIETQPNFQEDAEAEPEAEENPEGDDKETEFNIDDINVDDTNMDADAENAEKSEPITPETNDQEPISFAPDAQNLGAGVIKPEGAPTTGLDINISPDKTVNIKMNEDKKPSSGLSKEKKSEVVKKAKAGEDIGKKGKGFEVVAKKAAKEYGSEEKGKKVAAAAMWKNIKREGKENDGEPLTEAEKKIRNYVRLRLQELAGTRKSTLNENAKSAKLKQLDSLIERQYKLYENVAVGKKPETINEIFGFSIKEKLAKINPQDDQAVTDLLYRTFPVLTDPARRGQTDMASRKTPPATKYQILQQYAQNNGGTIRVGNGGQLVYAPESVRNQAIQSPMSQGGTQGKTQYGGV